MSGDGGADDSIPVDAIRGDDAWDDSAHSDAIRADGDGDDRRLGERLQRRCVGTPGRLKTDVLRPATGMNLTFADHGGRTVKGLWRQLQRMTMRTTHRRNERIKRSAGGQAIGYRPRFDGTAESDFRPAQRTTADDRRCAQHHHGCPFDDALDDQLGHTAGTVSATTPPLADPAATLRISGGRQ